MVSLQFLFTQKASAFWVNKVLVVYFSASGNAERAAQEITAATGGTLFSLTPTFLNVRGRDAHRHPGL